MAATNKTTTLDTTPNPKSRREKEIEATKKLVDSADKLLKDVDDWCLLQENTPREYPVFDRSEIKFGPLLGVGGFGIVFEVKGIVLKQQQVQEEEEESAVAAAEDNTKTDGGNHKTDSSSSEAQAQESNGQNSDHVEEGSSSPPPHPNADDGEEELTAENSNGAAVTVVNAQIVVSSGEHSNNNPGRSDESQTTTTTLFTHTNEGFGTSSDYALNNNNYTPSHQQAVMITGMDLGQPQQHDNSHYEIGNARQHMVKHVRRNGEARYAVKRLHHDLSDLERARGTIDLGIEAKILSSIWHPNIVKMRGISAGPMLSPNFFIVMDRLYEMLNQKMDSWRQIQSEHQGLFGIGADKEKMRQLMLERMIVAYDLAAAFWYMHDKKLVYRDIKQENVGFDVRGDVKVFDLGLCKGLSPSLKMKEYGYKLTPRTGSVPYMAPEVAECKPYDCKADVFSFSILLWEMLSLRTAFKGYSRREFLQRVVRGKQRLAITRAWPPLTRLMLEEGWDNDPQQRPDMKRVATMLRADLSELTTDTKVQNRTQHLRDRSSHSYHMPLSSRKMEKD